MIEVFLPDIAELGEPLPIAEASNAFPGTRLALLVEEEGQQTLKIVTNTHDEFISATPTTYPMEDPRILGFFPIVGRKGVNTVVRPIFEIGQRVLVRHQLDLGVCTVRERCQLTDQEYLDGDVLTRVGFYVRIDSGKGKKNMGYHEDSLEAEILHTSDV